MAIREEKQKADRHNDLFIWVIACMLLVWILFIGFLHQAR